MNPQKFHTWLEDPLTLDDASLPELEALVKEFPYAQTVELLFLLNLKKENDYRLGKQLRRTAASSPDRARLKEWMEWMEHPHVKDDTVDETFADTDTILEEKREKEAQQQEEEKKIREIEQAILDSMTEIEEKRQHLRSLLEEKKSLLSGYEGEKGMPEEETPLSRPLPKDEMLDDFLSQQNLSQKVTFFDPVEKARASVEDRGELISETLARLLGSQGKIAKAIKIYRQLMVNNPEKSAYFAAQIENLKKNLKE